MHLIRLPNKKEIRQLKRKLADFLLIDECKIKFHRHTTTSEPQSTPDYPAQASNVGYLSIKPLRKRKYTEFHEFLFKSQVTDLQLAPSPKAKHVVPLYNIVVSGSAPNIITTVTPLSTLFLSVLDFASKQSKTLFKLVHKLKHRNINYHTATSNTPALIQISNDLSGIPTLTASATINNADATVVIYKQKIKVEWCEKESTPDYSELSMKLSKKIRHTVHNVTVTLSKKSETEFNNVRIIIHRMKDVDAVKTILTKGGLIEDTEFSIVVNDKGQTVIKINVTDLVKFNFSKHKSKKHKSSCSDSESSSSDSDSSDDSSSSDSDSSSSNSSSSDSSSDDSSSSDSSSDESSSKSKKSSSSKSSSSKKHKKRHHRRHHN